MCREGPGGGSSRQRLGEEVLEEVEQGAVEPGSDVARVIPVPVADEPATPVADAAPRTGVGDLDRLKTEREVAGGNLHRYERAEEVTGRVLHILTATRGAISAETANWLW